MKYEKPYIEIIKLLACDCLNGVSMDWDDDWNTDDDIFGGDNLFI